MKYQADLVLETESPRRTARNRIQETPAPQASSNKLQALDPNTWVEVSHNEVLYRCKDLEIAGVGLNFSFVRTFKASSNYQGSLGHQWTHSYDQWLAADEGRQVIKHFDGDRFVMDHYPMSDLPWLSCANPEYIRTAWENGPGEWEIRDEKDTIRRFWNLDEKDPNGAPGKLREIADKSGNRLSFSYDGRHRLSQVVDTLGREIHFSYDGENRLAAIEDFTGRVFKFRYEGRGAIEVVS